MWIDVIHIIGQKQILIDMISHQKHGRWMFGAVLCMDTSSVLISFNGTVTDAVYNEFLQQKLLELLVIVDLITRQKM